MNSPPCHCDCRPADVAPGTALGRIAPCACGTVASPFRAALRVAAPPGAGTGANRDRRPSLRRPPCRAAGHSGVQDDSPGRGVHGSLSHTLPCAPAPLSCRALLRARPVRCVRRVPAAARSGGESIAPHAAPRGTLVIEVHIKEAAARACVQATAAAAAPRGAVRCAGRRQN